MPKIDTQQAQILYNRYASTLTNPLSLNDFIPSGEIGDITFNTYTHGMIDSGEQLLRIRISQFNSMDPAEPYDIGFANAIQLLTYILTGAEPKFIPKPESLTAAAEQLQSEMKNLKRKNKKLKAKKEAVMSEFETVKTELDKIKADLSDAVAAKSVAIKALEVKHTKELADMKKAAELKSAELSTEEQAKPKKKWSLGKGK